MYERVVEIILFLVNELRTNKQLNDVDVSILTRKGYTQSEISTAFAWLFDRLSVGQVVMLNDKPEAKSHRVLHAAEKQVIQRDAQGYLLQCHQLGLLGVVEMESIIEKIMSAGFSSVGIEEIKTLIAAALFGSDDSEGGASRISFDGNDTIH